MIPVDTYILRNNRTEFEMVWDEDDDVQKVEIDEDVPDLVITDLGFLHPFKQGGSRKG